MKYHSENIIRNFVLKVNKKETWKLVGSTPQQVEAGALRTATNEERGTYFIYATLVMAWLVPILGVPSGLLFLGYMATLGMNFGLVLCMMPIWVPYFIANNLEKKAKQCKTIKAPVFFSTSDLQICLLKAGMLGFVMIGTMLLILLGQR